MKHRASILAALLAATIVPFSGVLATDPLDPPVAPFESDAPFETVIAGEPRIAISIGTTPGDEDSDYKITYPGSYYLTGNLNGVWKQSVLEIAASNVTVDLNGFTVFYSSTGIVTASGASGITVRNGRVFGCANGILSRAAGCTIESVDVHNCGLGMSLADDTVARNCSLNGCGTFGIGTGVNGLLESCTVVDCGDGIVLGRGSVARNCVSSSNRRDGIRAPDEGVQIVGATADSNGGNGIVVGQGGVVRDCLVRSNGGRGIQAVRDNAQIIGCTADWNTGSGIETYLGCAVRECSANRNQIHGIHASHDSDVESCRAFFNTESGVHGGGDCRITDNTCGRNRVGIRVTGADNRVEDNHAHDNQQGLLVEGTANCIVRNTARGNMSGNYSVAAGNACYVVTVSYGASAIQGSSGGKPIGPNDPWANFAF